MQNVITTVGNGKDFITPKQLKVLKSVMQAEPAPTVSSKYKFFSTADMIDGLADHKWLPVKAQQQHARRTSNDGYQKHMVTFRQEGTYLSNVGDIAPELILTNAHNGVSLWNIMAGIFRLVCGNGMIVSDATFAHIAIKHQGREFEDVIDASYKVLDNVPALTHKIKTYQQIELNPLQQQIFAETALIRKYAPQESDTVKRDQQLIQINDRTFNVDKLLTPRRPYDANPTLWNVFNRVQEKFTQGDSLFESSVHTTSSGRLIRKTKTPGITGIHETIRVNRSLWSLMDEFVDMKKAA
jgi:hypothetical protein